MYFVFYDLILLFVVLEVAFVVFVFNGILELISLLLVHSFLIDCLHFFRDMVGWRQFALEIFAMLFLFHLPLLLEFVLFVHIIEVPEYRIVVVCFPVFFN